MTRIDSNPVFQSEKIGKKVHNNKVPWQKCGLLANTELEIASPAMGHREPGPGGYFVNWIKKQN